MAVHPARDLLPPPGAYFPALQVVTVATPPKGRPAVCPRGTDPAETGPGTSGRLFRCHKLPAPRNKNCPRKEAFSFRGYRFPPVHFQGIQVLPPSAGIWGELTCHEASILAEFLFQER